MNRIVCVLIDFFMQIADVIFNQSSTKQMLSWFQSFAFVVFSKFGKEWNGYEVHGLEKFSGNAITENCLMVGYHSRPTVDLIYLFAHLKPNMLISHLFFRIPGFAQMLSLFGFIPSNSDEKDSAELRMIDALEHGKKPMLLVPGGVFECMKSFEEIDKIQWKSEPGFAKLISRHYKETGRVIKVIPFYTKNCEKTHFTSKAWYNFTAKYTKQMYQSFKGGNLLILPFLLSFIVMSTGFCLLPLRTKLDTFVGDSIFLQDNETETAFSQRVTLSMQELIDRVTASSERPLAPLSSTYLAAVGTYILVQNTITLGVLFSIVWGLYPLLVVYWACQKGLQMGRTALFVVEDAGSVILQQTSKDE
jgi:hypothetical protein